MNNGERPTYTMSDAPSDGPSDATLTPAVGPAEDAGAAETITMDDVVSGVTSAVHTVQRGVSGLRESGIITEEGKINIPLKSRAELASAGAAGGAGGAVADESKKGGGSEDASMTQGTVSRLTAAFHEHFHKGAKALLAMFDTNVALARLVADYERDVLGASDEGRRVAFVRDFMARFGDHVTAIEEHLDMRGIVNSGDPVVVEIGGVHIWNACTRDDRIKIAKLARRLVACGKLVALMPTVAASRLEHSLRSINLEELDFDGLTSVGQHLLSTLASEDVDELRDSAYRIACSLGGVSGVVNVLDAVGGGDIVARFASEVQYAASEGGIGALIQSASSVFTGGSAPSGGSSSGGSAAVTDAPDSTTEE